MKVSLVNNKPNGSIEKIISYIEQSASKGAVLAIFPETAVTGLIGNNNPKHDREISLDLNGEEIYSLKVACKKYNIDIAIGIYEKDGEHLYDSAIYIDAKGELIHNYRRISKGWRWPNSDLSIYKEGKELESFDSVIGKVAFTICGDLFDNEVISKIKTLDIDYLIFPLARTHYNLEELNNEKWEGIMREDYLPAIKELSIDTFFVNLYDVDYPGGSYLVLSDGSVPKSNEPFKEGILIVEV